tara:strand:+ start:228 stop:446 length:219 start_codon:yes stop_codon:yes gene_type:complete
MRKKLVLAIFSLNVYTKAKDAITEEVANEEEEWEGSSGKTTTYSIEVQGQPVEPDAEQLISIESIRKRKRKK